MKCPECGSSDVAEKAKTIEVKIYARLGQTVPESNRIKTFLKFVCNRCKWTSLWKLLGDFTYVYDLSPENLCNSKLVVKMTISHGT